MALVEVTPEHADAMVRGDCVCETVGYFSLGYLGLLFLRYVDAIHMVLQGTDGWILCHRSGVSYVERYA